LAGQLHIRSLLMDNITNEYDFYQENFEVFKKIYENCHFITIPLARNTKFPVRNLRLEDIYKDINTDYEDLYENFGNIGIVTGRSGIVVFDCDTEKSIELFESLKNYKETAKVITRRGKHYYYRVETDHTKLHPTKWKTPDEILKIDLKAGHSYVVAPPSIVENHQYTWEPEDWSYAPPITTLTEEEFQAIVKELNEVFHKNKDKSNSSEKNKSDIIEKIVKIIQNYYTEGCRQDIILGIAGICRKVGIDKDTVLDIVEQIYKSSNDTDSIRQRFSAVELTYEKDIEQLAGWSLLEKIISKEDLQALESILKKEKLIKAEDLLQIDNDEYLLIDGYWYKKVIRDDMQSLKLICKGYHITNKYETESQKVSYTIVMPNKAFKKLYELDLKQLERLLGEPLLSEKDAKKIFAALVRRAKEMFLYERTGWLNEDIFLHPAIQYENIELFLKIQDIIKNKDFIPNNKERQHIFVREILKEGKLLALKFIFAVASLFSSFTIIDIAPRGVGKTITSTLAIQLFYRCKDAITTDATKTAMELMLHSLKNMPMLFDETALSFDDKIQALIFMVASRRGKGRGTKNLRVNITDLESVVFLTSEREIEFDRLGTFRRFLLLNAISTKSYTELYSIEDLLNIRNTCWGCGVDYIQHYLKNKEKLKVFNFLKTKDFSDFPHAVEKAVALLEDYYNEDFSKAKNSLIEVFQEQSKETEKDIVEIFIDNLKEFIAININSFITIDKLDLKGKIYGYIEKRRQESKVYIITSIFLEFCKEKNLPQKTILTLCRERGLLESPSTNTFRTMKRIPNTGVVPTYCFILQEPPGD